MDANQNHESEPGLAVHICCLLPSNQQSAVDNQPTTFSILRLKLCCHDSPAGAVQNKFSSSPSQSRDHHVSVKEEIGTLIRLSIQLLQICNGR